MSLMSLLRWANHQWELETPSLDHQARHTDDGGTPEMKPAPAAYLGLLARRQLDDHARPIDRPDNFRALACRLDNDGNYVTPLRCAIERIPDATRRSLARALVANLYFPSEIAEIYGVPRWCAGDVVYRTLEEVRRRYRTRPETPTTWVDKSASQQNAEVAA